MRKGNRPRILKRAAEIYFNPFNRFCPGFRVRIRSDLAIVAHGYRAALRFWVVERMSGAIVKIHDYCLAASTRRFFRQRLAGFRPRPIVVSAELQEGWHRRDVFGCFFS